MPTIQSNTSTCHHVLATYINEKQWAFKANPRVLARQVRLFLLREGESLQQEGGSGLARADQLDRLLMDCKDAIAIVREDLATDAVSVHRDC